MCGGSDDFPAIGNQQDKLASFSTRGSWIRVASPGVGITNTVPGGLYGTWNGTSMAAPLLAATAALIHAKYPNLRNDNIVDQIGKTGRQIDGPVQSRLDAGKALTTDPR